MTKTKNTGFILLFFMLVSSSFLFGQKESPLAQVKKYNQKHQYRSSLELLNQYRLKHKNDLYGDWLYAQTLDLAGFFSKSQREYRTLEARYPYDYDIKFDRIDKVIKANKLDNAITQLQRMAPTLPKYYNFLAHKQLAQVQYWKGDYDQADAEVNKALYVYNNEKSSLQLKKKINRARSNWAELHLGYFSDDQPLKTVLPSAKVGIYMNSMITAGASLDYPFYSFSDDNYTTPWLQVFSQFNFLESQVGLKVALGAIGYKSKEKAVTGLIEAKKQFTKYISLTAGIELAPYLATTFAIPDKLMQTKYGIHFDYNNPKGFIGKISYNMNQFPSLDNSFQTISGWVVSPPYLLSDLELRGGYGFNYSNSKDNTFRALNSIDTIKKNWAAQDYNIKGVYDPFFSPSKQMIHSLVAMLKYNISQEVNIGVDVNYGFSARSDAPYLFLDKADNGEDIIGRKLDEVSYHPLDINTFINYQVSDDLALKGFYKFQRTSYYQSNYLGVSTRFTF